ncbi:hypothetical protein H0H81_010494 [Sphagnurus paluster]|uniref:Crinkler effector protein N-terminal domain-containing protein n=1 Tax=Sphagnurus paluster TaxID=117069 RepID=A0A9P7FSX1_9AGAR|nr:hypothetical protein H0H81_010494 [Sphagnurus paluster]
MCLLCPIDDPRDNIVEVELDSDQSVAYFKTLIKLEYDDIIHAVQARRITLWKCCIPTDENLQKALDTVRFDGSDDRLHCLMPGSQLSEIFDAVLPHKTIHVLAQLPGECENKAPLASLPDLLKDRQQFNAKLSLRPASSLGLPLNFSKIQETDSQKIVWSRPPGADATIPVTLYHPIFRRFIDDCKSHQPIDEDNKLVREMTAAMSKFFSDGDGRAAELRDILQDNGIPPTAHLSSEGCFFCFDGAIESKNGFTVIFEVKEEIGSAGAEPYARAILHYANSAWKKSEEHLNFNFPCLIITVFGQPSLSSRATLHQHDVLRPSNMRESLARHFGALKKAIFSFEQRYDALTDPSLLKHLDPRFPDPRTYRSLETETTVNFEYLHQIDEQKLLFMGKTDNRERICIKFVRRYSREAHEKCAAMGIAPRLRGFEDIGAGWKMVIMDALDEEYEPFDHSTLPEGAEELLRDRFVELHQANLVHGDVRGANIMVRKDEMPGLMLVDYDWAGIVGEVRYPMNVNKVDIWWPDDVSDGLLIKPDHDIAMLEYIFRCSSRHGRLAH